MITLHYLAQFAADKNDISYATARGALTGYIRKIESEDGCRIDPDDIPIDEANYLLESVHYAKVSGILD